MTSQLLLLGLGVIRAATGVGAGSLTGIAGEASLQMAFAKIPTGWLTALDSALAEVRTASGATVH